MLAYQCAQPLNENNGHDQVLFKSTRCARPTTVMVRNYAEGVNGFVTVFALKV